MGSPEGNWFQWLKTQLTAMGITVWLPQLPHPEQPSLRAEADFVYAACPFVINDKTLVVGHSSGAILALILAQENKLPIGAVVAVSVFHDNSLQWDANNKLFDVAFDWPAIKAGAPTLLFVHADNDPYVPLDQAQYVADACDAEMVVMPGQGHFNLEKSADYSQFPALLELLHQKQILAVTNDR